jgi:hypothetical protein
MDNVANVEWRQLLAILLAQRLEIGGHRQRLELERTDDVLALLRVHSSPSATMLVPPGPEVSGV